MQSVEWDDNTVPLIMPLDDEHCYFYDTPTEYAFEEGDQIVHLSEAGPTVFRVVDVMPFYSDDEDYYAERAVADYNQVTIRKVSPYHEEHRVGRREHADVSGRR